MQLCKNSQLQQASIVFYRGEEPKQNRYNVKVKGFEPGKNFRSKLGLGFNALHVKLGIEIQEMSLKKVLGSGRLKFLYISSEEW